MWGKSHISLFYSKFFRYLFKIIVEFIIWVKYAPSTEENQCLALSTLVKSLFTLRFWNTPEWWFLVRNYYYKMTCFVTVGDGRWWLNRCFSTTDGRRVLFIEQSKGQFRNICVQKTTWISQRGSILPPGSEPKITWNESWSVFFGEIQNLDHFYVQMWYKCDNLQQNGKDL